MNEKLIKRLVNNKLFENIDISKLNFEKIQGKLQTFSSGQLIFLEGDPSRYVHLILSGEVNLLRKAVLSGPDQLTFTKDDFFGLEELAEGTNRICTAVATEDTYTVGLTIEEIQSLIDSNIQVQENIFKYSGIERPKRELDELEEATEEKIIEELLSEEQIEMDAKNATEAPEAPQSEEIPDENPADMDAASGEDVKVDSENRVPVYSGESPPVESDVYDNYLNPLADLDDAFTPPVENDDAPALNADYNPLPEEAIHPLDDLGAAVDAMPEMPDTTPPDIPREESPAPPPPQEEDLLNPMDFAPIDDVQSEEDAVPQIDYSSEELIDVSPAPGVEPVDESSDSGEAEEEKTMPVISGTNWTTFAEFFSGLISAENLLELTSNFEDGAKELFDAELCVLFMQKGESIEANIKKDTGFHQYRQKIGEGITGLAFEIGEKIVVQDAKRDSRIYADVITQISPDVKNLFAVPFDQNSEKFVLDIVNKSTPFTDDDYLFAAELLRIYSSARSRFIQMYSTLSKERKIFSSRMVSFLTKNVKSKSVLIKNYSQHLLDKKIGNEEKSLAKLIGESSEEILDKINFATIIDSDELNIRFVDISLNDQIINCINKHDALLKEKYCTTLSKFDEDVVVRIDPDFFDKVLWEILSNSIESMPFGGNIAVKTTVKDETVSISIIDNGTGVDPENLEIIFEPFVTMSKENRAGLGLAFVKKVIQAFNGSVRAEAGSDKGLIVVITLPVLVI